MVFCFVLLLLNVKMILFEVLLLFIMWCSILMCLVLNVVL